MFMQHYATLIHGSLLLCTIGFAGCSSSDQNKTASASAQRSQASAPESRFGAQKSQALASDTLQSGQDKSSLDALRRGDAPTTSPESGLKEVYFEFDRYDLDSDDRAILRTNAEWLKKNPTLRVEVEGHCDERGTNEYNLALGAKRAQAAKDYLMSLGVAPSRISATSYGEEIPVCREHSEDCWHKNRRDRFVRLGGAKGTF
jgi:peptidoglycan-associated lipoprotein